MRPSLALFGVLGVLELSRRAAGLQNLTHIDAYTNFSPAFLSAACAGPIHGAWSRCISGGGERSGGATETRAGRALIVPAFPRFAILNPMHSLVDHVWAWATAFSACVGDGTIVLMGVRREQVEKYDVAKDLTTWLELDLGNLIPVVKPEDMPDSMAQAPTWGQWFVWLWAKGIVGEERIVFEDDVRAMAREGICFEDGVLSLGADFFGTANRGMRQEFWPPKTTKASEDMKQAFPWADFPERWKVRGVQDLRTAITKELGLEIAPRKRTSNGTDEVRVLMTTRKGDWRRMWSNADAAVEALRKDCGDRLKIKVVDKTKGLSFKDQAQAYNWADVLISIHGASQANTVFMRDGSATIEVWQCCHEDISGRRDLVKAWTGWLFQRMHMTLSYIGGCTEVDEKGVPIELNEEEKQMEIGRLCGLNRHLNPLNVEVPVAKIPAAVRSANAAAIATIGQEPVPRLGLLPENFAGTQFDTRPKVLQRQYAPVGPGWTTTAICDARNVLMRVQHVVYDTNLDPKAEAFWEGAMNRSRNIQPPFGPPETYDSIIIWYQNIQWDFSFHVGLVPEDTFNSTAVVVGLEKAKVAEQKKSEVAEQKKSKVAASPQTSTPESQSERLVGGGEAAASSNRMKGDDRVKQAGEAGKLPADSTLRHRLQENLREPMWFFFFSGAVTAATLIGLAHLARRLPTPRKLFGSLGFKRDLRTRSPMVI